MDSVKITINVPEDVQDILIANLSDLEIAGFEQDGNQLITWFDEQDFDEDVIKPFLQSYEYKLERVKEKNWNEEWEKDFQPVVVDDFCAIRAHFHAPISTVRHEIIITPKMSFGTGHHATTYMMVQQMEEIEFKDKTVFDFGTGTGILAILAEHLGAKKVTAIDLDEWSINNALENLERNNCKLTEVYQASSVPMDRKFDIILANINKNVILHHLEKLVSAINDGGSILFSGLLADDENDIIYAYKGFPLAFLRKISRGNWISLYFSKTS